MSRPSAQLVAEWYAKLPPGSDIENARGGMTISYHRRLPMQWANDHSRPLLGIGSQLGAAAWRMPRIPAVADQRGRPRSRWFERRPTLRTQRRILRMLADGAPVREVQRVTGANFTVIAAVRRAALQWTDPDDE